MKIYTQPSFSLVEFLGKTKDVIMASSIIVSGNDNYMEDTLVDDEM